MKIPKGYLQARRVMSELKDDKTSLDFLFKMATTLDILLNPRTGYIRFHDELENAKKPLKEFRVWK